MRVFLALLLTVSASISRATAAASATEQDSAPSTDEQVTPATAPAPAATPIEEFQRGIDAFNKKNWDEAHRAFTHVLQQDPGSPAALYNLGLTEWKQGKKGLALARFRMALSRDSGLHQATGAIRELSAKVDRPYQARELSTYEAFRNGVLLPTSLTFLVMLSAVLSGLTGYLILRYLRARKFATQGLAAPGNDLSPLGSPADSSTRPDAWSTPAGGTPPVSAVTVAMGGLTVLAMLVVGMKAADLRTPRVTVTQAKAPLLAGPAENTLLLLEVPEGNELVVQTLHKDDSGTWLQVQLPGSLSGWMAAGNATLSAGELTW